MFARIFQKQKQQQQQQQSQEVLTAKDLDFRVIVHYGIPVTASVMAFDPIQQLLAIGTLDGRIKVLGDDNIQALLASPKPIPFKHLEFIQNQGFLATVSNENEIQVWDLDQRKITSTLKWESNITSFSVIVGTSYMYIGDEYGMVYVLKYDDEQGKLMHTAYYVPTDSIAASYDSQLKSSADFSEASGSTLPFNHPVVGVLSQPFSEGNRVLIAYEHGLIVVWDVSKDEVVLVRGNKGLHPKVETTNNSQKHAADELSDNEQGEKDISSLCWVTSDGSILAVGYVDGDIMFWNVLVTSSVKKAEKSSNNVAKLQLSSGERRLPVIALNWSADNSNKECNGRLFVYGGDEVGSEEVLSVLSLSWSSGLQNLKCVSRVDLTLDGSFADMVVSRRTSMMKNDSTFLMILSSPGKLHFYDDSCLSALISQKEKNISPSPIQFSTVIPTTNPSVTVGKLVTVSRDEKLSKALNEIASGANVKTGNMKWPLSGGLPSQLSNASEHQIERIYIAGYQDGSVRICDATFPTLSLIYVLGSEPSTMLEGVVSFTNASVSALDLCCSSLHLAIGNESGMVYLYKLAVKLDQNEFYLVTETEKEVQFANFGDRLAVGSECGQVSILDITTLSVLFVTKSISIPSSPVNFMTVKLFSDSSSFMNSPKESETEKSEKIEQWVVFVMTKDAHIVIVDSTADYSNSVAAMLDEKHPLKSSQSSVVKTEIAQVDEPEKLEADPRKSILENFYVVGESNSIRKVNLSKPCCWTTTFRKEDKECGLVILYQSGDFEIRSLPSLEVVGEFSLASLLRWNFKTNMEKTLSSLDRGQISLVNDNELAFISLLASENDFRIPESLPCFHDTVVAAAFDAMVNKSPTQKQTQSAVPGILGSIIKSFNADKEEHDMHISGVNSANLETIFSSPPFLKPTMDSSDNKEVIELNIDDILIDGPLIISSSPQKIHYEEKDKKKEKDKLLEGGSSSAETNPKMRTADEIKAKYRTKTGNAAAVAEEAKNKLLERGEKLQKLSDRTEDLQNGAQDFASMAQELRKRMENRKWWQF
ncbi:hypothetical protein ACFE04_030642 [Oxalis oulophora]